MYSSKERIIEMIRNGEKNWSNEDLTGVYVHGEADCYVITDKEGNMKTAVDEDGTTFLPLYFTDEGKELLDESEKLVICSPSDVRIAKMVEVLLYYPAIGEKMALVLDMRGYYWFIREIEIRDREAIVH